MTISAERKTEFWCLSWWCARMLRSFEIYRVWGTCVNSSICWLIVVNHSHSYAECADVPVHYKFIHFLLFRLKNWMPRDNGRGCACSIPETNTHTHTHELFYLLVRISILYWTYWKWFALLLPIFSSQLSGSHTPHNAHTAPLINFSFTARMYTGQVKDEKRQSLSCVLFSFKILLLSIVPWPQVPTINMHVPIFYTAFIVWFSGSFALLFLAHANAIRSPFVVVCVVVQ